MKLILVLSILVQSFSSLASAPVVEANVACEDVVRMLDDINSLVASDKMIELVSCEETHDELFKGLVKKNFRSKIQLHTKSGLCQSSEFVEKNPTTFGYGVQLGTNYASKLKVLEDSGFLSAGIRRGGGLQGNLLTGLHYPVCEN